MQAYLVTLEKKTRVGGTNRRPKLDIETKQVLTTADSAGNAMRWCDICGQRPISNLFGFHALDARVAPEELTENIATLGV